MIRMIFWLLTGNWSLHDADRIPTDVHRPGGTVVDHRGRVVVVAESIPAGVS